MRAVRPAGPAFPSHSLKQAWGHSACVCVCIYISHHQQHALHCLQLLLQGKFLHSALSDCVAAQKVSAMIHTWQPHETGSSCATMAVTRQHRRRHTQGHARTACSLACRCPNPQALQATQGRGAHAVPPQVLAQRQKPAAAQRAVAHARAHDGTSQRGPRWAAKASPLFLSAASSSSSSFIQLGPPPPLPPSRGHPQHLLAERIAPTEHSHKPVSPAYSGATASYSRVTQSRRPWRARAAAPRG